MYSCSFSQVFVVILKNCSLENPGDFLILCHKTQSGSLMLMRISSLLGEFECIMCSIIFSACSRAQNPSIADVIFQVEPEIKMFWLPISLLFSSKIILKQLFASGSVNIGEYLLYLAFGLVNIPQYLLSLRRIIVKYLHACLISSPDPTRDLWV